MHVQISTPEEMIFSGPCDDLVIEAEKGQLNILPRHTSLVSFVHPGDLIIRNTKDGDKRFYLDEGLLKVEGDRIVVLSPAVKAR